VHHMTLVGGWGDLHVHFVGRIKESFRRTKRTPRVYMERGVKVLPGRHRCEQVGRL